MSTMKNRAAAAMLAALMTIAPLSALAAETSALTPGAQGQPASTGEVMQAFKRDRSFLGISASSKWLNQARIGGLMLNLRLFTPQGVSVTFQEDLTAATAGAGEIRLNMRASSWEEELVLQLDQHAVDVLKRVGITEIVIADDQMAVRAKYDVAELDAIRAHFALGEKEQLCVSGEDNPVTVVSEDGVRRQITQ